MGVLGVESRAALHTNAESISLPNFMVPDPQAIPVSARQESPKSALVLGFDNIDDCSFASRAGLQHSCFGGG